MKAKRRPFRCGAAVRLPGGGRVRCIEAGEQRCSACELRFCLTHVAPLGICDDCLESTDPDLLRPDPGAIAV